MISELNLKGESILQGIESELIEVKIKAFDLTLKNLIPIKLLRDPYIRDFEKKLYRQNQILFSATRQILMSSKDQAKRIINNSFKLYFKKDPIYSLLLMYVPSFIRSVKISKILNKLETVNFRYYKMKILEHIAILKYLSKKEIDFNFEDDELLAQVFPDENVLYAYLLNNIEKEKIIYSIIKKGGNWNETLSIFDAFSSFSITMIPLYRLTSTIRKNILESLDKYIRDKIWSIYYKHSSCRIYTFKDCQELQFRHKILREFSAPPETVFKLLTDPEVLTKTNPEKSFKVTRLADNRMKYEITINLLLLKTKIYWEAVSKYITGENFYFEEWHIENSNYANHMEGFCLFERTPKNTTRYANVTKNFIPNEKLAMLGDVVINQLEALSNLNTEQMMKNIQKLIYSEKL